VLYLFQVKAFQTQFVERIEERKAELEALKKHKDSKKDFKKNMKKKFGTYEISEIVEKEKEGIFQELMKDYKSDKNFTIIMNKLKPEIIQMILIQSIQHVLDKPKNLEDANKEDHSKLNNKSNNKFIY